jgi:hypothetical protein
MRQRFSLQQTLGITPIAEVAIPKNSRHELAPVLAALQHIFITPELNERVFALIELKIKGKKQDTGRTGMDIWEILVLAVVRLTLNANYDALHHFSNFDKLIRQIMGVENRFNEVKTYAFGEVTNLIPHIVRYFHSPLFKTKIIKMSSLLANKLDKWIFSSISRSSFSGHFSLVLSKQGRHL